MEQDPEHHRAASGLTALEARLHRDLELLCHPPPDWVPAGTDAAGKPLCDVLIVGGGMCGLSAAFALSRQGVRRVRIVDARPRGREGPWVTYARMRTLRSPKHLVGPAMGLPSLTFRAWYEAQWGDAAWDALGRIPRTLWMDYLRWYRTVLDLPVENETRVTRLVPADHGFSVCVRGPGGEATIEARKVIVATGREGLAVPRIPEALVGLPPHLRPHSSEAIDFPALRGLRVAVLGIGASALDNAAEALEAGAAEVHQLVRARAVPRINKAKGIVYPGFVGGFASLPDGQHLELLGYITSCRVAPPRDSVLRVAQFENFNLHLDSPVTSALETHDGIEVSTPAQSHVVDRIILGTGFRVDLASAPELALIAPDIARWRDRFEPDPPPADAELMDFPYLGAGLQFLERAPGQAPHLRHLYCFNLAAFSSHGYVSSDIPAVSEGAARLAAGIARDLFVEDADHHRQRLHDFDEPELLGDEITAAQWSPPP